MLNDIFCPSRIKLNLEATTKADVFAELIETIAVSDSEFDRQALLEAVKLRESKMNTNILPGVAVPHGYCPNVNGIIGAMGFSKQGIEFDGAGQEPLLPSTNQKISGVELPVGNRVHLFFLLIMDESSREQHLHVLSRLLDFLNSTAFSGIQKAKTPNELYGLLCRY